MKASPEQIAAFRAFQLSQAGKPYRPSNGTDGEIFESDHCDKCARLEADGVDCPILGRAYAYSISHPDYPAEWVRDNEGFPTCTAFWPEGKPEPYRCQETPDMFNQPEEKEYARKNQE